MQFQNLARNWTRNLAGMSGCRSLTVYAPGLVALVVCGVLALPGQANAARRASMVIDGNTGRVLHASQPDRLCYPASLTKMMTLFIVFDELKKGRLKFGSRIKISKNAAAVQPSKLGLKPGKTISVRNAIKALITKSANDVAIAVAEHIAGSEAAFARRMTRRARQLGMAKTRFTNASGLPDTDQVTTPRDILKLATGLMDVHKKYYHLFAMRSFTFKGRVYKNHNGLLRNFRGTDGLKTGYTRASGFNLVASTHRGAKHVIGAVFGGKNVTERNSKMRWLLTQAFKRASKVKTRKPIGSATKRLVASATTKKASTKRLRIWKAAPPRLAKRPGRRSAKAIARSKPRIRIARVRPVKFANPVRQTTPQRRAELAAQLPAPALARAAPSQAEAAPAAPSGVLAQQSVLAQQRDAGARRKVASLARQPSTFEAQAARLGRGSPVRSAPVLDRQQAFDRQQQWRRNVAGFGAPTAMRRAMLGARPESLRIDSPSGVKAQSAADSGQTVQTVPTVRPAAGKFQVQIGAYGTIGEAQQRIEDVQILAGSLLSGYASVTIPYQKANKQYYRARFAGFDSSRAASTCNELRQRQIDCFVAKGR